MREVHEPGDALSTARGIREVVVRWSHPRVDHRDSHTASVEPERLPHGRGAGRRAGALHGARHHAIHRDRSTRGLLGSPESATFGRSRTTLLMSDRCLRRCLRGPEVSASTGDNASIFGRRRTTRERPLCPAFSLSSLSSFYFRSHRFAPMAMARARARPKPPRESGGTWPWGNAWCPFMSGRWAVRRVGRQQRICPAGRWLTSPVKRECHNDLRRRAASRPETTRAAATRSNM